MAITFANAGTEGTVASGDITPGAPASPVTNDIWVCVCHTSDQVVHAMSVDWTNVINANGGGTTSHLSVWWHRYAGVAPSLLITRALGEQGEAGVVAFRGCVTTGDPVNTVGTVGTGTDASIEFSGITPTEGSMIVAVDGAADDNVRSAIPTDFTAALEDTAGGTDNCFKGNAGLVDGSVALYYRGPASGPTGDLVATQAIDDPWASVLLALTPAAGEGTYPVTLRRRRRD